VVVEVPAVCPDLVSLIDDLDGFGEALIENVAGFVQGPCFESRSSRIGRRPTSVTTSDEFGDHGWTAKGGAAGDEDEHGGF
jgi:hypothetical protein